jgi:hypothetical protein
MRTKHVACQPWSRLGWYPLQSPPGDEEDLIHQIVDQVRLGPPADVPSDCWILPPKQRFEAP